GDAGNCSAVFSLGGATFAGCTFYGNTNGAGGTGGTGGAGYLSSFPGAKGGNGGKAGSGTLYCTGAVQLIACTSVANTAGKGGNAGSGGAGANNTTGGWGGNGGNGGNGANGGSGGGIFGPSTNSAFTLQNVLIAQNLAGSAGSAGAGGAGGSNAGSSGSAGTNGVAGTGSDLNGSFISQGHNLVGLSTGNTGFTNNLLGDIVGTNTTINAKVGLLTNNSGWVWTCALQNGSPALDVGDDTITGGPLNLTNDARGYPRKSGSHVDIGAYENQWAVTLVNFNAAITGSGVQLAIINTPGAYFTVLASSSLTTPLANWTVLGVMSEISPGQFQWTDASYANRSLRFFRLRNP
ncbi:MAG: choice-of-anchor Q domain-containing protein, partial [Verrucomicrobiota bacterium]